MIRPAAAVLLLAPLLMGQKLRLDSPRRPSAPLLEEVKAILARSCTGSVIAPSGCSVCPKFTHPPADHEVWRVEAIYYGHFTSADADEAALAMGGCEPHSLGFGSTAFFKRENGAWKMRWYQSDLILSDCLKVTRSDGRDVLVCERSDAFQGYFAHQLSFIDLSRRPAGRASNLLVLHEEPNSCGASQGTGQICPLQITTFREVRFEDGKLEVRVEFGWRIISRSESDRCLAGRQTDQRFRPRTSLYHLTLEFDGEAFHLTPESQKTKRLVETDKARECLNAPSR